MMKYKPIYPSQESVLVAQSLSARSLVEVSSQSHFSGSLRFRHRTTSGGSSPTVFSQLFGHV